VAEPEADSEAEATISDTVGGAVLVIELADNGTTVRRLSVGRSSKSLRPAAIAAMIPPGTAA
jgi:hypothetical protein